MWLRVNRHPRQRSGSDERRPIAYWVGAMQGWSRSCLLATGHTHKGTILMIMFATGGTIADYCRGGGGGGGGAPTSQFPPISSIFFDIYIMG